MPSQPEPIPSTEAIAVVRHETSGAQAERNFIDQRLDFRSVSMERTNNIIVTLILSFVILIVALVMTVVQGPFHSGVIGTWAGWLIVSFGLGWLGMVLPRKNYEVTRWTLDDRGLEIRRGIWWRHVITVPRARIQHTDVQQGPLMRHHGLAKLIVHTAGTHDASIELGGLAYETAEELRDTLVAESGWQHDAV